MGEEIEFRKLESIRRNSNRFSRSRNQSPKPAVGKAENQSNSCHRTLGKPRDWWCQISLEVGERESEI